MSKSRFVLCALGVAALFFAFVPDARAASSGTERITDYHTEVTVREDATVRVTETIRVVATGERIKRGIYRTFPTRYRDAYGRRYNVTFEVKEVTRDGHPEPWHLRRRSNGVAVYVGDENVFLQRGDYTYRITYETDWQVGFFDDHDELYWNATGNDWDFVIERATATVNAPTAISRADAYSGRYGERGRACTASIDEDGAAHFATTAPLQPGKGLTIVAGWPKGFVREPTPAERFGHLASSDRGAFVGLLGLLAVVAYYLAVWARVGRDPARGTIIPLYEPPEDLSPGAARFVRKMGFDHRAFTAAVINMAVKGYLSIQDEQGQYTLRRTPDADPTVLAPEEKRIADRLFSEIRNTIVLENTNHSRIRRALEAVERSLRATYEKRYFMTNRRHFIPGVVLSGVAVLLAGIAYARPEMVFIGVWLTFWTAGVGILLAQALALWRGALFGGRFSLSSTAGALGVSLFVLPFVAGELLGLGFLVHATSPAFLAVVVGLGLVNLFFYHLLKAPTRLGRDLLDRLDGFRMFLQTSEEDRFQLLHPPRRTPELFERYLPYALALGVENQWAEQFSDVLSRAGSGPEQGYTPSWYVSGTAWRGFHSRSFTGAVGAAMTGAIASSSVAPSSSSGFGGGGSSGGGGGGGGGGAW